MTFRLHIKTEFEDLDLREVLQSSPNVLFGVSEPARALLETLGVETVYDLALGSAFTNAARIVQAAGDPASVFSRHGVVPADLVDAAHRAVAPKDLPGLPTDALLDVGPQTAAKFDTDLGLRTIRDLAFWPPYLAAQKLVTEAYAPERRAGYDPEAPSELIPRAGDHATQRVRYTTTVLLETQAPKVEWDGGPIDSTSLSQVGFKDVAFGALVHLSQTWSPKAVALGELLHSLPLAPGESTRLSVVDWTRRVRASTEEEIAQSEFMSSAMHQSTAISEVTSSVAREFQTGDSVSGSAGGSVSASTPGLLGLVGINAGGGASGGVAGTYTTSSGRRSVATTAQQNVASRTQQNAALSRSRRAAIVSEVSERESERISTRIVVNNNHMHALSIQYYEVVQTYETVVDVDRIERCIFIPMKLVNFRNESIVRRYLPILAATALDRQTRDLLLRLGHTAVMEFSFDRFATTQLEQRLADLRAVAAQPIDFGNLAGWIEAQRERAAFEQFMQSVSALRRRIRTDGEIAVRRGLVTTFDRANATSVTLDRQAIVRNVAWGADSGVQNVVLREVDSEVRTITTSGDMNVAPAAAGGGRTPPAVAPELGVGIPVARLDSISVTMQAAQGASPSDYAIVPLHVLLELRGRFHWLTLSFVASRTTSGELRLLEIEAPVDVEEVSDRLMSEQLYYSQQIWRRANRQGLIMQLANLYYRFTPGPRVRLIDYVDPTPVTVAGNYLAFRFTYEEDEAWRRWKKQQEAEHRPQVDLVPLATGGVFAEAVLSEANAAEKLDATRFWKWQESPIPFMAPEVAPVEAGRHFRTAAPAPGQLPDPVLRLQAPIPLPALANSEQLLRAAVAAKMFRDMGGAEITRALISASIKAAQEGDMAAVKQANDTLAKINAALANAAKGVLEGGPKVIETAKGLGSALNLAGGATGGGAGGAGAGTAVQGAVSAVGGAEGVASIASQIGPVIETLGPALLALV